MQKSPYLCSVKRKEQETGGNLKTTAKDFSKSEQMRKIPKAEGKKIVTRPDSS